MIMVEKILIKLKKRIRDILGITAINKDICELKECNQALSDELRASTNDKNQFILSEIKRLNEDMRYRLLGSDMPVEGDDKQTRDSFDYQWVDFNEGQFLPNDQNFMSDVQSLICKITDLGPDWFPGKRVADVGCGTGRFTYGLLSLGASVLAVDQSEAALRKVDALCNEFSERLSTLPVNLLEWDKEDQYDLVFSFGVVHHTGNTYLAIINAARKVRSGGRLFMMVYGFPETISDYREVNSYEELRQELRLFSNEEKTRILIDRYGESLAHGWFDAVSPRINDLLTFSEIGHLLKRLGFVNIKRTINNRNHHIVGDKR